MIPAWVELLAAFFKVGILVATRSWKVSTERFFLEKTWTNSRCMANVHRYSTRETDLTHTVLEWWYEDLHGRQPVIIPAMRTLTRAIRCAVWRLRRVINVLFFISFLGHSSDWPARTSTQVR